MPTTTYELREELLTIDFELSPYDPGNTYGPPENCYPPEGGECRRLQAYAEDGREFPLTDDEYDKIARWLEENHYDDRD